MGANRSTVSPAAGEINAVINHLAFSRTGPALETHQQSAWAEDKSSYAQFVLHSCRKTQDRDLPAFWKSAAPKRLQSVVPHRRIETMECKLSSVQFKQTVKAN